MQLKVGDWIKQAHWDDNCFYQIVEILPSDYKVRCPARAANRSSDVFTMYPHRMNWVKKPAEVSQGLPCNDCGAFIEEEHQLGCITCVDEGRSPAYKHDPLPSNALSRFPTHPSDILIMLDELQSDV